jgi:glycosyltransferase involved in cell wall biosynthesis
MKIAFVSTFYPFRGGIAQFNASLYRALEQNHEVKAFNFSVQYPKVLFPGKTQFVAEEDQADAIDSERILSSVGPISYRKTVKAIENFKPDLVIISYWMPFMAPSLGFVAGKLKQTTKVVSIIHNALPHERSKIDGILSHYFFRKNSKIVTLSGAVREQLASKYNHLSIQTLLHPTYNHFGSAIDKETACSQLNIDSLKTYLLFFGLVRDYKGLDLLLNTLKFLPDDIHLIIAGETYGSFENYQEIINRDNLRERVHHFDQYIPDQAVHLYFSCADLCVLPYKSATQSGITAIALELDTPVLATNVGGLSEFIIDGENGVLVPAEIKPESLSQSIKLTLTEEKLRYLKSNCSKHKPPNWDEFASELIKFATT